MMCSSLLQICPQPRYCEQPANRKDFFSIHQIYKIVGTGACKTLLPLSLTYSNLSILYASEE